MKRKLALVLGLVFLTISPSVFAASGIGIAPAIQEVELRESDEQVSFSVTIANTTELATEFKLSTLDFGALDESGGVAFLGRTGQETTTYGLSKWMSLDKTQVRLEPGKTEEVRVTIKNEDSLSPGGHYGAVVVSSTKVGQLNTESVETLPAASTLVLLKKYGGETLELELDSIKANNSLVSLPSSADLRFHNVGNTHVVPRGTTTLTGPFNSIVSRGVINEASGYILPDTYRIYDTPFQSVSQPWLPGRYTLKTEWRFDGKEQTTITTTHYWYLGKVGVGVLILISSAIVLYMFILYRKRPVTRN